MISLVPLKGKTASKVDQAAHRPGPDEALMPPKKDVSHIFPLIPLKAVAGHNPSSPSPPGHAPSCWVPQPGLLHGVLLVQRQELTYIFGKRGLGGYREACPETMSKQEIF